LEMLGTARKVTLTKDETTIVTEPGDRTKANIQRRVAQIRRELDETDSDYDREKLQERLAKLAGGVAVIKVGAATETELKDKKLRIEDALNATKAAIEEGIVPGGGSTLIHLAQKAEAFKAHLQNPEEQLGADIVRRALSMPLTQIAGNAGEEAAVIVEKVETTELTVGYNVISGKIEDMVMAGVVDPAKVVRTGLQDAASIAAMVLTTEVLVVEKPEPPKPAPAGGDPMGGMGGMGGMGMM